MKKQLHSDRELNNKYNSQKEYNKRNYRLEKNTFSTISDSDCLRWMAERRYL